MKVLLEILLAMVYMIVGFMSIYYLFEYILYRLSHYKNAGGHSFYKVFVRGNNGAYGEYLTYLKLLHFKVRGAKILTNLYLPDKDNTSEIDLLMIDKTGIYVFESKNYSGWIFGREEDYKWTQKTRMYKNQFQNPVRQNKKHIEVLNNILNHQYDKYTYSYIVFSVRCSLKKIQYHCDVKIVKRNYLVDNLSNKIRNSDDILSKENINDIYNELVKYINSSEKIKQEHKDRIYNEINNIDTNKYELKKINLDMGTDEYEMYQDIPKEEINTINRMNGINYDQYKDMLKYFVKYENEIDPKINTSTTRYIMYVNDRPVGEIAIRTTANEYYQTKGSQIFYKMRLSDRNKGYGTKMLSLVLQECKKLGLTKVYLNCNDKNIGSQKVITNNGGIKVFNYGESSRYKIEIK